MCAAGLQIRAHIGLNAEVHDPTSLRRIPMRPVVLFLCNTPQLDNPRQSPRGGKLNRESGRHTAVTYGNHASAVLPNYCRELLEG